MTDKQKAAALSVLVLSAALCAVLSLSVCLLYRITIRLETERLRELVHSHAVLFGQFSRLAKQLHADDPNSDPLAAALTEVFNAHLRKECFGRTGEFLVARLERGQIVFLQRQQHLHEDGLQHQAPPASVPFQSALAEPMRQTLSGRIGTMIGPDYRGKTVLAAFHPVPETDLGLVGKIDLAEVRQPFFRTLAIAGIAALPIIAGSILILLRFNPFLHRLEEERSRARTYLDLAGTLIAVLDAEGRMRLVNRQLARTLGAAPAQLTGQVWSECCVHAEDRAAASAALADLLTGLLPRVDSLEFRLVASDGGQRTVEWSARAMRDRRGRISGVIAAGADMTERKQIEDVLRQSQQAFQATFEQAAVGIGHVRPDGKWLRVNRKLCSILGYTDKELLAKTIQEVTHPAHLERSLSRAKRLVQDPPGVTYVMEKQYVRKDGTPIWVNHTVSLVRDEQGRPQYYISVLEDIQARKEMENALRERTELLAWSNKELDDFAYIASHDLKEPLRGIMSYSTFLLEDFGSQLGEEVLARLKTMQELAGRLSALTDDLLTFSRVGRLELACRCVDLNQLVQDVLATLKVSLEREKVGIRIPKPLPKLRCDAVRMREVYCNLISNALKYNDKEEKWIEIGALGSKDRAVFYVCDNGIGIQEKHLDKVFAMFKRLHGKNKYGGGTGAGLAIVKKIIERHDGHIWLESVPDQGTAFFFTIGGTCNDDAA